MLNEGKIKLMTKMAAYEKHEGKNDIKICRYFKADYIGLGILKNGIAITLAYMLCVVIYLVCNIDYYLRDIANLDYNNIVVTLGKYYLIFLIVFTIIAYVVYAMRYDKSKGNVELYSKRLKKLEKYYNREEQKGRR